MIGYFSIRLCGGSVRVRLKGAYRERGLAMEMHGYVRGIVKMSQTPKSVQFKKKKE